MSTEYGDEKIWSVLSKRWNLRILKSLELHNVIRFNQLKQSISGISSNVLSERLDELEKLGLVKKIITDDASSHVGYILAEDCRNLKNILLELDEWISLWKTKHAQSLKTNTNIIRSNDILTALGKEITETEFNFIKDKLAFELGADSSDLINNFTKLQNIMLELYGEEAANKIFNKLNEKISLPK